MRRHLLPAVLAAALLSLGPWCCSPAMQKPPQENPVTADLVDYRNGLEMLKEGRVDEALAQLRAARASSPADPKAANALGVAYLYKKDYARAIKNFDESIALDGGLAEARLNRGVARMEMGQLADADADFQAILDGPPSREKVNAHFNRGVLLEKQAKPVEAETELSLVLAEDPLYLKASRERGLLRVKMENFSRALEDLLKVLRNDPNDGEATYNAALCLLTTGRRDLAVRYMERTVTVAPETEWAKKARRFLDAEPESGAKP